ncbi:MAG: type II toxin-antitoxin system HicB family antitoxin [Azoarcus sp.]|jgi:predicted RNase H-like HicB family nuclease|nr:type II toxin-antitoxin system HicB family antitoxin [Azoarcus sp.]
MKFVIAIEPATDSSDFGVAVPDLPGCFSAGKTLDEALDNAKEAVDVWCEAVIEDGGDIPVTRSLSYHQKNQEFDGWVWAVIDVPVERYFGPAEKLNITIPRMLLARIDNYVKSHGITRSGFLAEAARKVIFSG